MNKVTVSSVLFLLLVHVSFVSCQIRMRPSQLKLSLIGDSEAQVMSDHHSREQISQESKDQGAKNPMKVPAFVVTKIDGGICKCFASK